MSISLNSLLSSSGLMPHGMCLMWKPELLILHVVSDTLIALSYFSIPFALAFFVSKRKDLEYRWMFNLFAAFILACGTSHVFDVWTLWRPDYLAQGLVKAATALISLASAILLWPVLRQALQLPSPRQLALINDDLSREIAMRRMTVSLLEAEAHERRQLEARLRRNEARLKTVLDTAVEGILTVNEQGVVDMCNRAAARMFGYRPGELAGLQAQVLMRIDDQPLEPVLLAQLSRRRHLLERPVAYFGCKRNGDRFPLEISVGVFQDGRQHYTCIVRDISERIATEAIMRDKEARLKQQQGELRHMQRLSTVGELAAMMAHEINQPLGAIVNYLGGVRLRFGQLLQEHPGLADTLEEAVRLAQRTSAMVQGIRNLVKPREADRENLSLGWLITETLTLLKPELDRRHIALVDRLPAYLPPVEGQRIHLQQLLLNLILNAVDAMEPRPVSARQLVIAGRQLDDAAVEISLTDTGIGFPADQAQAIFEPFVTSKRDGIGLGLSICKSIVEAHGGEIRAVSSPAGSTFTVRLPVASAASQRA